MDEATSVIHGPVQCPGLPGLWTECPGPAPPIDAAPLIGAVVVIVGVTLFVVVSLVLLVLGTKE